MSVTLNLYHNVKGQVEASPWLGNEAGSSWTVWQRTDTHDQFDFTLIDHDGTCPIHMIDLGGIVTFVVNGKRLFYGYLMEVIPVAHRHTIQMEWRCKAYGIELALNRRFMTNIFITNGTDKDRLEKIIEILQTQSSLSIPIAYGNVLADEATEGFISQSPVQFPVNAQYIDEPIWSVLTSVADETGFLLWIDEHFKFHYLPRLPRGTGENEHAQGLEVLPFGFTDDPATAEGSAFWHQIAVDDPSFTFDITALANRVRVKGGFVAEQGIVKIYGLATPDRLLNLTQRFVPSGNNNTITVEINVNTNTSPNWQVQPVTLVERMDTATTGVVWSATDHYLEFLGPVFPQQIANSIRVSGDIIHAGIVDVEDTESILNYGIFQHLLTNSNLRTSEQLHNAAAAILNQRAAQSHSMTLVGVRVPVRRGVVVRFKSFRYRLGSIVTDDRFIVSQVTITPETYDSANNPSLLYELKLDAISNRIKSVFNSYTVIA